MTTLAVLLLSAGLAAAVILLRLRFADRGVDVPGHRSLHVAPTPHGGGLGIVLAFLAAGIWAGLATPWLAGAAVLAAVSVIDDWCHLPIWLRLPIHLGVAASVVFLVSDQGWTLVVPMTIAIAWATNAYNFMDGADALAGTMAVIGFGAYATAFALAGLAAEAMACAAVVGGSAGFLGFNRPPARIFMGDVGSIPLGFLAGGLGWYGVVAGAWPGWFGPLVFAPFLLDATLTLLRRALRGERVWEAHREHLYQRMVRAGLSHGALCRRWAVLMAVGALIALVMLYSAPAWGWVATMLWWSALLGLGWRVGRTTRG